nr:M56 family metallopeptidase [uncultured Oscillibacter sp.]
MMNTLAGMGLAGSAVLALWLLASKVLKDRMPARWHYRVLKISLFFFLIPVGQLLALAGRTLCALRPSPGTVSAPAAVPAAPRIPVEALPRIPAAGAAAAASPVPVPARTPFVLQEETLKVLALVWAAGAAAMLAYKICVYCRLRWRLFRQNRPVSSQEARLVFWACRRQTGIRGPVELRENPAVRSPFAAGLLRPTVVIPAADLEREELRYLFLHELTHIRCGDLWVRFWAMLAQVLHWYNPLAWLLCRSIHTVSEQSCDERVACPLPPEERYLYGNVILKLAANAAAGSGDWAATLSARESMERRLTRVLKTEKLRGYQRLLALVLALAILACGGGAALAARNPLPVSREEMEPAHTVMALPKEEGTGGGGENAPAPGPITAPAAAAVPAPTEAEKPEEPEEPEADRPVTTNGTPSEAFLKELRAHFIERGYPVTEDTPVVFGDHELILKRGGTLLPDEDFESYGYKYPFAEGRGFGRISKCFVSKRPSDLGDSYLFEEYAVGNEELFRQHHYAAFVDKQMATLVDGDYPKNSRGETYGEDVIADYVGYYPDLCETIGDHNKEGYVTYEDFHVKAASRHLLEAECPHEFSIPLYDKEHNQIGTRTDPCNGHYAETGMSIDAAKAALAAGETIDSAPTYDDPSEETLAKIRKEAASRWTQAAITDSTPILFGDRDLILRCGGTLLPDNDLSSYTCVDNVIYKRFLDKNGGRRDEYKVGNKELVGYPGQLKNLTADGDYPKNSKGESYGSETLAGYVGYAPDLRYRAEYPPERRPAGYIREAELHVPDHTAAECKKEYAIPLYNPEGEVIGQYLLDCGGQHIDTTGMSIEDVKAALAAGASTTEEAKAAAAEAARTRVPNQEPPANPYTGYRDAAGNWHQLEEVRGDLDLIRSRGGTILPDDEASSYISYTGDSRHVYRRYRDKDGVLRREDRVGNKDLLPEESRALLNTLVKGEYPKNASGESCGYECLADYVGCAPDLAVWVEGPEQGYWRQKEMENQADALHFACKCPGEFRIPLYAFDGKTVKTHVTYICPYSVHLE